MSKKNISKPTGRKFINEPKGSFVRGAFAHSAHNAPINEPKGSFVRGAFAHSAHNAPINEPKGSFIISSVDAGKLLALKELQ